jgi:hypothetical protein
MIRSTLMTKIFLFLNNCRTPSPPAAKETSAPTSTVSTPKKGGSKLPRLQTRVPSKSVTPRGVKPSGHLVCGEIKISGPQVVAHLCSLSVTVVNESADTLQCDLFDLVDSSAYTFTSQAPVMLLSKRTTTLHVSIFQDYF